MTRTSSPTERSGCLAADPGYPRGRTDAERRSGSGPADPQNSEFVPGRCPAGSPGRPEVRGHQRLDLIMGIAGTPGFGGRGRPVTVWTMNASAPPGSSVSYMVSATPCSSVQWKDWPKVTGTALARLQASPQPDPGPPDVHDLSFLGCATALGKLAGLRVQADR